MATNNIKNKVIFAVVLLILAGLAIAYWQFFGSQEAQNKWARKRVTLLEGDYNVTYTDMSNTKIWEIRDGKVTSEPGKGYYFFWARNGQSKEFYVQVPIARTYIEEIKD